MKLPVLGRTWRHTRMRFAVPNSAGKIRAFLYGLHAGQNLAFPNNFNYYAAMYTKNTFLLWLTSAWLVAFAMLSATAHAVNYATATKSPPGYQFKLFPFYYGADTRTNKDGDPVVTDLGLQKYGVMIGNFYQIGDFQLNAIIPVVKMEIGKYNSEDFGVGDIQLRAGWNLPVEWASIMPALMVKVPSGSYDKLNKANAGDGQTDLVTELYFFKMVQPLSFDAVLKYNVRYRNPDSDVTPGNEFIAESLLTYRLAEKIRVGPAVNFIIGHDNQKGGITVADSGLMRLAVGGELYYGRFDKVKISLAAYQDVLTRNTNEGTTVMSRIAFGF